MTDDDRLRSIERKLDDHGATLKEMSDSLSRLAVQDERLKNLESQQQTLWRKYDSLTDPNIGQITDLVKHKASCPRNQIKFLWWFVAVVDFGLLLALLGWIIK